MQYTFNFKNKWNQNKWKIWCIMTLRYISQDTFKSSCQIIINSYEHVQNEQLFSSFSVISSMPQKY